MSERRHVLLTKPNRTIGGSRYSVRKTAVWEAKLGDRTEMNGLKIKS
jgi:hypothetical protein